MDSSHVLLRLPLDVRIRIYRFCGLIRSCPIDLNLEGVRRQHRATYFTKTFFCPEHHHCRYPAYSSLPPSLECFCPSMPLHLLLVSHAFYDELFPILFGENQFKVSWQKSDLPDYHLYWLRALSPKAWSFIKSLHIGLTNVVQSGLLPTPNDDPFDTIDSKTVDGGRVIQKWAVLCGDVLSQIPGGRLKFSLGCNVSDTETAIRVTEPLGRLQLMAELAICLNAEPDKNALREVARRAALSLTVKKRKSGTWQMSSRSWNDLPKEIRLDILSHTDLVDRYWSSDETGPSQRDGFEIESGKFVPRPEVCCGNCSSTLSICSCTPRKAAFSTTCICPTVPGALLRVSKLFFSESIEIFFSRNRFILSGDFAVTRCFLLDLPPVVAQHLRIVDLEISLQQLQDMRNVDSQTARDWEVLVASVASLLRLPKVWLSIDAGDMRDVPLATNDRGIEDDTYLHTSYPKIFNPLYQHLRGAVLRKFRVFLCYWPDYEELVEREVMGPDYESSAEGKPSWKERRPRNPHVDQVRRERRWALDSRRHRLYSASPGSSYEF